MNWIIAITVGSLAGIAVGLFVANMMLLYDRYTHRRVVGRMRQILMTATQHPIPYFGHWHSVGHVEDARFGQCVGCALEYGLALGQKYGREPGTSFERE